jgi:kynurenine formamidase
MRLVDQLDAGELLAPVVVIDVTRKALDNPNARVEPDDLIRFERRHGRIPDRALVCMNSGWASKAADPAASLGGPAFPDFNFPGFGIEATGWLLQRRSPVGIGVVSSQAWGPRHSSGVAAGMRISGASSRGPASSTSIRTLGSSPRRPATTHPAPPAPTIT